MHPLNRRFAARQTAEDHPKVPRSALIPSTLNKSSEDELPEKIASLRRSITTGPFWTELKTIEKLISKNRNQHRRSGTTYFRKLILVVRTMKRLNELGIDDLLLQILRVIQPRGKKQTGAPWKELPSARFLTYVRFRLAQAATILDYVREPIEAAHLAFRQLMGQTFFVPLSLLFMASLSRMHLLAPALRKDVCECYHTLSVWTALIPPSVSAPDPELSKCLPANLMHFNSKTLAADVSNLPAERELIDDQEEIESDLDLPSKPSIVPDKVESSLSASFWGSLGARGGDSLSAVSAGDITSASPSETATSQKRRKRQSSSNDRTDLSESRVAEDNAPDDRSGSDHIASSKSVPTDFDALVKRPKSPKTSSIKSLESVHEHSTQLDKSSGQILGKGKGPSEVYNIPTSLSKNRKVAAKVGVSLQWKNESPTDVGLEKKSSSSAAEILDIFSTLDQKTKKKKK
ncbi:hypothetical protein BJ742DRAFT_821384 [Cladochytrium replicatum]|nr:hypothetical protein BJ742DRAFT_821384 [Cladochytrium replicatum]